jgi:hypothetical protein
MARRNKSKIYSIILINHGKQLRTICSDTTEEKIYKRFKKILEENKKVAFPIRYNNHEHVMIESEYELVIIKCREEYEGMVNKVRTDTGEFTDYTTTDDDWIVIDRAPYNMEETFWVYGYHPVFQRKDFNWIYENLVSNNTSKTNLKQVLIYQNKLLISTTFELNMVLCKNMSDCIRLYNELEKEAANNKAKYVYFCGDVYHSLLSKSWFNRMKNLTGWDDLKLRRKSLRP